jgi:hypothetical protein
MKPTKNFYQLMDTLWGMFVLAISLPFGFWL